MPSHNLRLKIYSSIILQRNLNPPQLPKMTQEMLLKQPF